jgi:ABC-type multidrug transport system fused ATPase/permease subunit
MYTAHGILACLAWVAIFPIGGIMIRLLSFPRLLWVHAGLQITGYCLYIAAMVLGILLSINPKFWRMHDKHVIIGLILFVSFFFQGITGYVHHLMYKKEGRRTAVSFIHLWTGRVCITLAMINAGFGFQLTHKGTGTWQVKTYTVFAVVMWVLYVVSIVVGERRKRRQAKERAGANIAAVNGSTSDSGGSRSSVRREHEVMGGEKYMAEDRA